jgi:hypothetical protein
MSPTHFLASAAVVLALAFTAPAEAANFKLNAAAAASHHVVTVGGKGFNGGGFVALMTTKQCLDAGGRIANNPSCYGGKQCRGIMNEDCIEAAK